MLDINELQKPQSGRPSSSSVDDGVAPQVISLFCGAGGLDLGFEQAGFTVAYAGDISPAAVNTHNRNFASPVAEVLDISAIKASDLISILAQRDCSPVGVIGGPPCQGFSRANTQRSFADPRNQLARNYANILCKLADHFPLKFFVFENVPELLAESNAIFLKNLKRKLSEKFWISLQILNAADFGVPQNRSRVFIVGIRKVKGLPPIRFTFPEPNVTIKVTVRNAIEGLPPPAFFERGLAPESIPHHPNHWTMRPKSKKFGAELVNGGRSLVRLLWDKPSRTVAYGHREIHVHPTGLRRLSIHEAMILQGFPRDYVLTGNLSEQVTQVSNAVPPPVAKALALALFPLISNI